MAYKEGAQLESNILKMPSAQGYSQSKQETTTCVSKKSISSTASAGYKSCNHSHSSYDSLKIAHKDLLFWCIY